MCMCQPPLFSSLNNFFSYTHPQDVPIECECVWLWNLSSFYIFRKSQIKYIQVKWVCCCLKKFIRIASKKIIPLACFSYLRSLIIKRVPKNYVFDCKVTFCASEIALNFWYLVLVNSVRKKKIFVPFFPFTSLSYRLY